MRIEGEDVRLRLGGEVAHRFASEAEVRGATPVARDAVAVMVRALGGPSDACLRLGMSLPELTRFAITAQVLAGEL